MAYTKENKYKAQAYINKRGYFYDENKEYEKFIGKLSRVDTTAKRDLIFLCMNDDLWYSHFEPINENDNINLF